MKGSIFYIFLLLATWKIANGQTPFTCKGQYYLSLTKNGSQSSGLYEVKIPTSGAQIYLDTISTSIGLVLNGMGYRITDNLIYGIDPNTAHLRKIGSDGVAIDLGLPKGIPTDRLYYAGDVTPDGKFLLLIGLGGFPQQIVKIDLDDPEYACTFVGLKNNAVGIVDIAFDPFTGIMYGHDLRNSRIVTINPDDGSVNINFKVQSQVDQLGALFFDSFGNLYGYGAYGSGAQDKFVSIDKKTGDIRLLASGPISVGQDGCACPYTLELQKIVTPEVAFPCTDVVYSFIVSNGSGITRSGINLHDTLPDGLTAKSIIYNPFGGNENVADQVVSITEMVVKPGIDTIKLLVSIDENALGIYKNQAHLSGLPLALGSFTLSDYPYSFLEKDSTTLMVEPLDISFIEEEFTTCKGDSVFIDASLHGVNILWSDGDESSRKWLVSPGKYTLSARTKCDVKQVQIDVKGDQVIADILEDTLYIELGDYITLHGEYKNIDENVTLSWISSEGNSALSCQQCLTSEGQPIHDGYYVFLVKNAQDCYDSDTVWVRVKKDRSVFTPNIISANSDGQNDKFYLFAANQSAEGVYLRIYDRWGNLVFERNQFALNDSEYGWDGTFLNKPVVQGVFTWTAMVRFIDQYELVLHGDVTVIR
ncbi:MAG TPA: gliding motility-associated C-terminal domain-containing protein [Saprospiraceae bacterium]|nr:gliding motility-associated C-terminal domain-containing protein [Saprospiraceae bacterium]